MFVFLKCIFVNDCALIDGLFDVPRHLLFIIKIIVYIAATLFVNTYTYWNFDICFELQVKFRLYFCYLETFFFYHLKSENKNMNRLINNCK